MASRKKDDEQEALDPVVADRVAELERQEAVSQAVYDATHDKDGTPVPIVVPEG